MNCIIANISSAYGTIFFAAAGTQEDIGAFIPGLDCWEFYEECDIQSYDCIPTVDNLKTSFYGCGRWSFPGTLLGLSLDSKPQRTIVSLAV